MEDEKVARRIHNITESSTIRMAKLSRELKAQGEDIINLSLGEPDFETPDHIKKAAAEAIEKGFTHYPPVAGYPELREAIANKFERENGLKYKPSQIVVSTGAKQSLMNIMLSLLDEGDEVIVPVPYWVTYPEMIKFAGGTIKFIETGVESGFKITAQQLEKAITPRTKAFVYSSPSNPTGSFYTYEELKPLAEVFARHPQVFIISDEIYEHINFTGKHASLAQFPEIFERTIVVNGVSKGFAMTGWRIGYMAGPEWLAKACEKIQGQFTSAASSISQHATIAALNSGLEATHIMTEAFKARRDLVVEKLKDIPGIKFDIPEGAFYLFPDVKNYFGKSYNGNTIKDADDLCMYLLGEAKVSLVAGTGFGAPDCIRISFAASREELEKAMDRISEALAKLA